MRLLEIDAQTLLVAAVEVELERRECEFSAFTASVLRTIELEARNLRGAKLEDQAIAQLESEVDGELQALAPSFEGPFQREVESRIFRKARACEGDRTRRLWPRWGLAALVPLAAAAGAAWLALWPPRATDATRQAPAAADAWMAMEDRDARGGQISTPHSGSHRSPGTTPEPSAASGPGRGRSSTVMAGAGGHAVAVEQVSFAGDVLVVPEDALTVIYLAGEPSQG